MLKTILKFYVYVFLVFSIYSIDGNHQNKQRVSVEGLIIKFAFKIYLCNFDAK